MAVSCCLTAHALGFLAGPSPSSDEPRKGHCFGKKVRGVGAGKAPETGRFVKASEAIDLGPQATAEQTRQVPRTHKEPRG